MQFDISNLGMPRSKVIFLIVIKFHQFKSKFTTSYVFGSNKAKFLLQNTQILMKELDICLSRVVKIEMKY